MSIVKLASYELAQTQTALLGFNQESLPSPARDEPDCNIERENKSVTNQDSNAQNITKIKKLSKRRT